MKKHLITPEVIEYFKENYKFMTDEELSNTMLEKFGFKVCARSIRNIRTQNGLNKTIEIRDRSIAIKKFVLEQKDAKSIQEVADKVVEKFGVKLSYSHIVKMRLNAGMRINHKYFKMDDAMRDFIHKNYQNFTNEQLFEILRDVYGYTGGKTALKRYKYENNLKKDSVVFNGENGYLWKLYEDNKGNIPKGSSVIHLDGDQSNYDLDNLLAVDKKVINEFYKKYGKRIDKDLSLAIIKKLELERELKKWMRKNI